jgi:threonine dehydrogenase-like Zn-dependent dehydrogenase
VLTVQNTETGLATVDIDQPTGGGVRVRVASAGICGTDLRFVETGVGGFIFGHEFAGVTSDGREVFVEPTIYCGRCEQCRRGAVQLCTVAGHGTLGVYRDGGMCEQIVVPEYTLLQLPAALPLHDACLIEPASVAWHGVSRARVPSDERVVIVGGGSIGLLAAAACRHQGIDVALEARHPHQREAATRFGAEPPEGLYDVVIDAAGSAAALGRCVELARPGGRVVLLSVYSGTIPLPATTSLVKELTIVNSIAYQREANTRETALVATMLAGQPEHRADDHHPPLRAARRRRGVPRGARPVGRRDQGRARVARLNST